MEGGRLWFGRLIDSDWDPRVGWWLVGWPVLCEYRNEVSCDVHYPA